MICGEPEPLALLRARHSHPFRPVSDPQPSILQRVAGGEPSAVQECIDRYGSLVWSLARGRMNDVSALEDVVQDIFVEIWKSAGRYDSSKASEGTFIATIARRRLIDRQRAAGRRPDLQAIEDDQLVGLDGGIEHVDIRDDARVAAEAVQTLNSGQRRAVLLSVVHGLSHSEIAELTKQPLGTVKSNVRRGLQRVRELLGREEGEGVPT